MSISEDAFPAVYRAADKNSFTGQRRYVNATRLRLAMLVVAAVAGSVTIASDSFNVAAVIAALAFGLALLDEIYLLNVRPDRRWYDGRAVAESAKTLAWRFMVGGQPFGLLQGSEREAEEKLLERLSDITRTIKGVHLVPASNPGSQISDEMRAVRRLPFGKRKELYRAERIEDQCLWYSRKAQWNEQRATRWTLFLATVEAIGFGGAIARVAGWLEFDFLGIASAVVAAGVAWLQTKQHQNLASAYSVAAQELAEIASRIGWLDEESEWANFVDQSEEAISREHTLWRASHS